MEPFPVPQSRLMKKLEFEEIAKQSIDCGEYLQAARKIRNKRKKQVTQTRELFRFIHHVQELTNSLTILTNSSLN